MMRCLSHWRKPISYESLLRFESQRFPGVRFSIRKISLGQRIELSARVRELTQKNEFLRAGDVANQLDAELADLLVQKLYLDWAVADIDGIRIDGETPSVDLLVKRGPDSLVAEIGDAIRNHLELSDAERKNC